MRSALAVVCAATTGLSGCSFVFLDTVSESAPPVQMYPCDEDYTWPAVDGVLAALSALGGILSLTTDEDNADEFDEDRNEEGAVGSFVWAGVFGVAAFYGTTKVKQCRAKNDEFRRRFPNGPPQPYPQPYPPQPYPPQSYPPQPYGAPPPGGGPAPGQEGGACYGNGACAPGLVCASGLCVRPPGAQPQPAPAPAPPPPGTL